MSGIRNMLNAGSPQDQGATGQNVNPTSGAATGTAPPQVAPPVGGSTGPGNQAAAQPNFLAALESLRKKAAALLGLANITKEKAKGYGGFGNVASSAQAAFDEATNASNQATAAADSQQLDNADSVYKQANARWLLANTAEQNASKTFPAFQALKLKAIASADAAVVRANEAVKHAAVATDVEKKDAEAAKTKAIEAKTAAEKASNTEEVDSATLKAQEAMTAADSAWTASDMAPLVIRLEREQKDLAAYTHPVIKRRVEDLKPTWAEFKSLWNAKKYGEASTKLAELETQHTKAQELLTLFKPLEVNLKALRDRVGMLNQHACKGTTDALDKAATDCWSILALKKVLNRLDSMVETNEDCVATYPLIVTRFDALDIIVANNATRMAKVAVDEAIKKSDLDGFENCLGRFLVAVTEDENDLAAIIVLDDRLVQVIKAFKALCAKTTNPDAQNQKKQWEGTFDECVKIYTGWRKNIQDAKNRRDLVSNQAKTPGTVAYLEAKLVIWGSSPIPAPTVSPEEQAWQDFMLRVDVGYQTFKNSGYDIKYRGVNNDGKGKVTTPDSVRKQLQKYSVFSFNGGSYHVDSSNSAGVSIKRAIPKDHQVGDVKSYIYHL